MMPSKSRQNAIAVVHAVALCGLAAGIVLTAPAAHWSVLPLAALLVMTMLSEVMGVEIGRRKIRISANLFGLVLAAVLLGAAPAALVGLATMTATWLRLRPPHVYVRHNLTVFGWFPLLTGLAFHAAQRSTGLHPAEGAYYLLVFAAYVFALTLNVAMIFGLQSLHTAASWWGLIRETFTPVQAAELFAAILTLAGVFLDWKLGAIGLALFALVIIGFQYLVRELLTSQHRAEELHLLATRDELTGLANRKSFDDRLNEEIRECGLTGESFPVILLDLDRFKEVNDTLGHQYGDMLLTELGPRLAEHIGPDGLVARLGGDEFAVLTGKRTSVSDVVGEIATALIACIHEPIAIDAIRLELGSSVGVSRFPFDGTDAQTLLRRADIAMYAAKAHRDGFRLYAPEFDHHSTERLTVLGDFRRALGAGEIEVHYQPIVDPRSLRVAGAEALVRWNHPELGMLAPGGFIAVVEQTGLMGSLTAHVLDQAIAECARWRADGEDLTVSVNLSVRNLDDPELPGVVGRSLRRHALPPHALKLEITESMIFSDPERALACVHRIRSLGVRFAVDDFGTGHSSLANLKRLPVDDLKIDRCFVMSMLEDSADLVIVRSTVALGHDLGLTITGEGVEDAATLDRLGELGCDLAQGYHLSRPMPASTFAEWLAAGGYAGAMASSRATISPA